MRILLVEDEVLIAMEQRYYLEAAGHEVFGPTSTAAQAVALASEVRPDLALVDLHLARGSLGTDAARAMTSQGITCLFVTSFADELRGNHGAGIGCLTKPFTEASLVAAVRVAEALRNGRTPQDVPGTMQIFG